MLVELIKKYGCLQWKKLIFKRYQKELCCKRIK